MTGALLGGSAPVTDAVTGAYLRALLPLRLDEELSRADRTGTPAALLLFDVDYFKSINDTYGHLRGDQVLGQLAQRVAQLIRPEDALFRYGGDEFVLLLPETDLAAALRMALRLIDGIRSRPFEGDPALRLSVSMGVASYPLDATTAESLISCADRRNYLAKRRGRDGAVADDAEAGPAGATPLLDRDVAVSAAQAFLTRLQAGLPGALQVVGETGSGHTRFLAEVGALASRRGFTVRPVAADGTLPAVRPDAPLLLVADLGTVDRADAAVRAAGVGRGPVVGLVYAATERSDEQPSELPLHGTAELTPWSVVNLRIWLGTELAGEPSRSLVHWLMERGGRLPAVAARELQWLRDRSGLVRTEHGSWSVSPGVLGRRARGGSRLPVPMTGFVGRTREQREVADLLRGGPLVTLIGPGGIGKTRLSLAVAAGCAAEYPDGAVFVPLADARDDHTVLSAIAQALKVDEVPGQPLRDSVLAHLAGSSMLIVLDNFEQVTSSAGVVGDLLAASDGITALVTSRERLDLPGEQIFGVPPLPLPDLRSLPGGADAVEKVLADSPAIELFQQRAQAVDADFELTAADLPAVAEICRRLDALPLAIELAAARTDRWQPAELLVELVSHFAVLGEGPRDFPARQRTLRGAIEWSFVLLDEADQRLFSALAVFAGGCDPEAAAAVAAGPGSAGDGIVGRLGALAGKSLLLAEVGPDGERRYRMLETIRDYAESRLASSDQRDTVHERHAAHYAAFAERCGEGMTGPDQPAWVARQEREYANLRVAFDWAAGRIDAGTAGRICLGLWRHWRNGNHLDQGREWLDRVLAQPGELPDRQHAQLLLAASILAGTQDDHQPAARLAGESLRLAEAAGDPQAAAQARNALGMAAMSAGDYALATDHYQHGLDIWRELGLSQGTAIALGNLSKVTLRVGDLAAANRYAAECLELERAAGNTRGIVLALESLGQVMLAHGDAAGARPVLEEGLLLSRELGDVFGEAMALHQLGVVAHRDGDQMAATRLLAEALAHRHEIGDREDLATSLDNLAAQFVGDRPGFAARLLGAARELRDRNHLPNPPESETRQQETLAAARCGLADEARDAEIAAGRAVPLDLLVDQVLDAVEGLG